VFKLKNITVAEYLVSKDFLKYDEVLRFEAGQNFGHNISSNSYTNVKYCLSLLQKVSSFDTIIEVFEILFGIKEEELMQMRILDYYRLRNHLINTMKLIQDNENKLAQSGKIDIGKWKMAGGDRLKPFDDLMPLDQLGERYGIYPYDIGRKPYSEVFMLMAGVKTLNEVNYNYTTMK